MKKATVKFQLKRDGELYNTVYDTAREAKMAGDDLISCGWIKDYDFVPVKAIWLRVR